MKLIFLSKRSWDGEFWSHLRPGSGIGKKEGPQESFGNSVRFFDTKAPEPRKASNQDQGLGSNISGK